MRGQSTARVVDFVAGSAQRAGRRLAELEIVFDDQHPHRGRLRRPYTP
jgi:hypothetical protein